MITDLPSPANDIGRALRDDLQLAATTVDRLVHLFADTADDHPLVARMVDDLTIVRQDIDDALKGAGR